MASVESVTVKLNCTTPTEIPSWRRIASSMGEYVKATKEFPAGSTVKFSTHGEMQPCVYGQSWLDAAEFAYSNHRPLTLSPDDLWLTILVSFNGYMRKHAEAMRSVFVQHQDKAQLIIDYDQSLDTATWSDVFQLFERKIGQNVTPGMSDALMPNFTTTTDHLRSVAQILLMGVFKDYFSYGIRSECGIPSVTLLGTLEDWQKLKTKVEFLGTLSPGLQNWVQILIPVMDNLIDTYQQHPNYEWWDRIIHYKGGSGSSDISGWVLAFFPFNNGTWQLNSIEEILSTGQYGWVEDSCLKTFRVVQVPVKGNFNGTIVDLAFVADCRNVSFNPETAGVRPDFHYAVLQLPDGTITDQYDWQDTSVKVVSSSIVPLLSMITSKHHGHMLTRFDVPRGSNCTCDVCKTPRQSMTFGCRSCDFDVCIPCLQNSEPRITSRHHVHTLGFLIPTNGLNYRCDVCGIDRLQTTFACRKCNFDACMKCAQK